MIGRPNPADVKTPAGATDERHVGRTSAPNNPPKDTGGRRSHSTDKRALPACEPVAEGSQLACARYRTGAQRHMIDALRAFSTWRRAAARSFPRKYHRDRTRGAKRPRVLVTYN